LERTYEDADKLRGELQDDLDQWLNEQESLQDTTIEREKMHKQLAIAKRIMANPEAAKREQETHDSSLMDEIAKQLDSDL
jgi:hypothetical protein